MDLITFIENIKSEGIRLKLLTEFLPYLQGELYSKLLDASKSIIDNQDPLDLDIWVDIARAILIYFPQDLKITYYKKVLDCLLYCPKETSIDLFRDRDLMKKFNWATENLPEVLLEEAKAVAHLIFTKQDWHSINILSEKELFRSGALVVERGNEFADINRDIYDFNSLSKEKLDRLKEAFLNGSYGVISNYQNYLKSSSREDAEKVAQETYSFVLKIPNDYQRAKILSEVLPLLTTDQQKTALTEIIKDSEFIGDDWEFSLVLARHLCFNGECDTEIKEKVINFISSAISLGEYSSIDEVFKYLGPHLSNDDWDYIFEHIIPAIKDDALRVNVIINIDRFLDHDHLSRALDIAYKFERTGDHITVLLELAEFMTESDRDEIIKSIVEPAIWIFDRYDEFDLLDELYGREIGTFNRKKVLSKISLFISETTLLEVVMRIRDLAEYNIDQILSEFFSIKRTKDFWVRFLEFVEMGSSNDKRFFLSNSVDYLPQELILPAYTIASEIEGEQERIAVILSFLPILPSDLAHKESMAMLSYSTSSYSEKFFFLEKLMPFLSIDVRNRELNDLIMKGKDLYKRSQEANEEVTKFLSGELNERLTQEDFDLSNEYDLFWISGFIHFHSFAQYFLPDGFRKFSQEILEISPSNMEMVVLSIPRLEEPLQSEMADYAAKELLNMPEDFGYHFDGSRGIIYCLVDLLPYINDDLYDEVIDYLIEKTVPYELFDKFFMFVDEDRGSYLFKMISRYGGSPKVKLHAFFSLVDKFPNLTPQLFAELENINFGVYGNDTLWLYKMYEEIGEYLVNVAWDIPASYLAKIIWQSSHESRENLLLFFAAFYRIWQRLMGENQMMEIIRAVRAVKAAWR